MTRWALAAIALSAACLPPPSPAQQVRDGEAAVACVVRDWGKPVDVVARDCTQGVVDVAVDLIADGVALLAAHGAPNPYAADPRVRDSIRARFAGDAGSGATAPATGAGPAGQPAVP
jgi:hypothetical protein